MLAVSIYADDEKTPVDWRLCLVPKSDYEIIDTWYAMGMAATGSKDVAVSELFVPERRALALLRCRGGREHPGAARNPGPLLLLRLHQPFVECADFLFVLFDDAEADAMRSPDNHEERRR